MTNDIAKTIGYTFKDGALLTQALTHASAGDRKKSYERLEFLGDRILGFVISEMLYLNFANEKEGALAKRLNALVQQNMLKTIADEIGLQPFIHGQSTNSVVADVLEALIAALYLDGGFDVARKFIHKYWEKYLKESAAPPDDDKSRLQEWAQSKAINLPHYRLVERTGPDHKPSFVVEVTLADFPPQRGEGASKQAAEKAAATALYQYVVKHG